MWADAFEFQKERVDLMMVVLSQFWCFVLFDGKVSFGKAEVGVWWLNLLG